MRMMEAWTASASQLRRCGATLTIPTSFCARSGCGLLPPRSGLDDWLHPSADGVPIEAAPSDLIDEAIDTALRSIQRLVIDQRAQLDAVGLERLAVGLNRVRRAAEAANVAVAERVVATNPFRGDGFLTGKNWLAHRLQLSKREAFHRCQMARMHPRLRVVVRGVRRWVGRCRADLVDGPDRRQPACPPTMPCRPARPTCSTTR